MDKRVLIIDDDKWVVMSTQMVLEAEGYEVRASSSGSKGFEQAKSTQPSVILLDILMPGIDGWETLERLKADPATQSIPVIIFSARETPSREVSRLEEIGNVVFFKKPFRPDELVELVRKSIRPVQVQSTMTTY